jgi:hypothetical protein
MDSRPVGTLGLFFSAWGYTLPAAESAAMLRPMQVLLFGGNDVRWALAGRPFQGRMAEMVRRKQMLAVKYGRPDREVTDVVELFGRR